MANRLDGKVAIVVGGATGFGRATAERFIEEGATVIISGRREGFTADVAAEIGAGSFVCDINDFDQLGALADSAVAQHGGLDIAVNYAGYEDSALIRDITPEHLEPMVDVQFNAAIYFMRHMGNAMASSGGGSIISVSSLTAHSPSPGRAAYAGAKAGLEYVTQIAAVEYGPDNVRVNAIAPHVIETDMTAPIFKNPLVVETVRLKTPLRRMGHVLDVANCAVYLASDESGYVSGETIKVDGAAFTQNLPSDLDYALLAGARPELVGGKAATLPDWYVEEIEAQSSE